MWGFVSDPQVSREITRRLKDRAKDFHILLDDVSITHMTFGREYTAAVEAKQVAQQEAERAKFLVEKAIQDTVHACDCLPYRNPLLFKPRVRQPLPR